MTFVQACCGAAAIPADACCIAFTMTSGGCAPDTAYLRSKTKKRNSSNAKLAGFADIRFNVRRKGMAGKRFFGLGLIQARIAGQFQQGGGVRYIPAFAEIGFEKPFLHRIPQALPLGHLHQAMRIEGIGDHGAIEIIEQARGKPGGSRPYLSDWYWNR